MPKPMPRHQSMTTFCSTKGGPGRSLNQRPGGEALVRGDAGEGGVVEVDGEDDSFASHFDRQANEISPLFEE